MSFFFALYVCIRILLYISTIQTNNLFIMKTEIIENASKYYEKNFMAKQLSALEFLSDIAWDMNTAKRLIEIAKDDIAKYMTAGYHSEVINQRRRALIEHEQNLKELQDKYNQLLTFLNENK